MSYIRIFLIIAVASILFLPMFFAPAPLVEEPLLVPLWSKTLSGDLRGMNGGGHGGGQAVDGDAQWVPLFQNDNLLYVSTDGDRGIYEDASFYLEYDSRRYFNTGQYHNTLVARSPEGSIDGVVESNWFPVLSMEGMLLISPDGFALTRLDEQMNPLYTREWASLIVKARVLPAEEGTYTVVGLLDGRIIVLDESGENLFSRVLKENSRYPVIYNFEPLSPAGSALELVVIAGYAPLYLYRISLIPDDDGNLFAGEILHTALPFQIDSPVPIFISREEYETFHVSSDARSYGVTYDRESRILSKPVEHDAPGVLTEYWQNTPPAGDEKSTPAGDDKSAMKYPDSEIFVYRRNGSTTLELYGADDHLWFQSIRSIPYSINYAGTRLIQRIDSRVIGYELEEG